MLETAEVTRQFIETIIEIIGRKTSEEYAAVTVRNLLKKLQLYYPFLKDIEIKNTRVLEMESIVSVQDDLNRIPPKEVGKSLKDLVIKIMNSLGKTAGYFFIRETREKIGIEYDKILLKVMDVDLSLMQSNLIIEKKSINLLEIQKSDVVRIFLKILIDSVEKQSSKSFAISCVQQNVVALQQQFSFFEDITITDIRVTLGEEDIIVDSDINTIDPAQLGRALTMLLQETDKVLIDLGRNSVANDLKTHLTYEYLTKLKDMGVLIASQGIGYSAVFTHVLKTIIDVIEKTSSEDYAIFAVNSFLRNIDNKYDFLKEIKIEQAIKQGELYHIIIKQNIDSISETDARRAIQNLLECIIESLGEKISDEFLVQFKNSLDKKYLSKLEEMGVNFHMIELHEAMLNKMK